MFRALALAGCLLAVGLAAATAPSAPRADKDLISIPRPGDRDFVVDLAHLINAADTTKIKQLCNKLLTDKATPIIVVTIESMADYGGSGMRIETFAQLLFDQWGVGIEKLDNQPWNTGMLLLVSKNDRKARIELGRYWRRDQDLQAQQIMEQQIIPHFKQGDFSGGIVAGVEALDKLARGLALPSAAHTPMSTGAIALMIVGIGLAIFTIVSLVRNGTHGWGWLMWAAIFGVIGYLLYEMATNRGSGGGGFSGGSFGGGSSGGGGATGSW